MIQKSTPYTWANQSNRTEIHDWTSKDKKNPLGIQAKWASYLQQKQNQIGFQLEQLVRYQKRKEPLISDHAYCKQNLKK